MNPQIRILGLSIRIHRNAEVMVNMNSNPAEAIKELFSVMNKAHCLKYGYTRLFV